MRSATLVYDDYLGGITHFLRGGVRCFLFNIITFGATMGELGFRDRKKIRGRLLAIYKESGKITERDLLRLSALSGVKYSSILEVHKATYYGPKGGLKDYLKGRATGTK